VITLILGRVSTVYRCFIVQYGTFVCITVLLRFNNW